MNWIKFFLLLIHFCFSYAKVQFNMAVSLLVHPNFSSNIMITWISWISLCSTFKLSESLLFVRFEQIKVDQKQIFEQFINHVITLGILLLVHFCSNWTKSRLSNSLKVEQKGNSITWSFISKRNSSGPKVKRHAYASRDYLLKILNWIKNYTLAFICATKLPKSVTQTL